MFFSESKILAIIFVVARLWLFSVNSVRYREYWLVSRLFNDFYNCSGYLTSNDVGKWPSLVSRYECGNRSWWTVSR